MRNARYSPGRPRRRFRRCREVFPLFVRVRIRSEKLVAHTQDADWRVRSTERTDRDRSGVYTWRSGRTIVRLFVRSLSNRRAVRGKSFNRDYGISRELMPSRAISRHVTAIFQLLANIHSAWPTRISTTSSLSLLRATSDKPSMLASIVIRGTQRISRTSRFAAVTAIIDWT